MIIRLAALHRPGENAVCNVAFDVFRMIRMAIVTRRPTGRSAKGVGVKDGVRQRDEQEGNDKNDTVRHLPEKAPGRRIKSITETNDKLVRIEPKYKRRYSVEKTSETQIGRIQIGNVYGR